MRDKNHFAMEDNVNQPDAIGSKNVSYDILIIPHPVQSEFQVLWELAFNKLAVYSVDSKQVANYKCIAGS